MDALEPLFDLRDELSYAIKISLVQLRGLKLLSDKLNNKLASLGTSKFNRCYDIDNHEVLLMVVGQGRETTSYLCHVNGDISPPQSSFAKKKRENEGNSLNESIKVVKPI
jgi:hypothetical protein